MHNLLIGILFLHVLTTYMMRAYRPPREITWITGVLLLFVFLAFGFSGYLLPWNQLSFFATRVGTAIVGAVPVVGRYFLLLARSGEDITGDTLARFYALHVVILPLTVLALIAIHLFLVQKHEISIPPAVIKKYGDEKKVPSMSFIPQFLLRDMVGWYVALGILAALAALFPWELGQKADPFGSAPPGIKPEWYFLFMFQTLKHLPAHIGGIQWLEGEMVGVLFFGFCGLVVLAVPFLDFGAEPPAPAQDFEFPRRPGSIVFYCDDRLGTFRMRIFPRNSAVGSADHRRRGGCGLRGRKRYSAEREQLPALPRERRRVGGR